ncbi:hypothetical protein ACJIZ3_003203 [Penstemon smallii]|uniref:Uncharacterized protein n=1 Tax=Penstemon smallii TaxID=265156 RepID=A0ABD3UBM5_9LAMI
MMFIQMRRTVLQLRRDSSSLCEFNLLFSTSTENQQTDANTPSVSKFLVHKHHLSLQVASRVASVLKSPEKSDSVLSFWKQSGFSNTHLEKIVKYRPRLLSASLEKSFKPKIKIFQDLGFSADEIAKILSTDPAILHCSVDDRVIPSLAILRGVLGSDEGVAKVLRTSGSFLAKDLEKTLIPNVKFLESCGVQMEQIIKVIYSFPRFLLHKPEIIRKSVCKADEMGVSRSSRMFIYVVRVISSLTNESLQLKLQAFRDMGFSEDEILKVFRMTPHAITVSEKKMKKLKEVVLSTGKYDMSSIVNNPVTLCCSIENRYIPRFRVFKILESKNLITSWPSLGTVQTLSDKKFIEKFVDPYLHEVGDVYKAKSKLDGK